jgi:hypothetical protein
MEWWWWDGAAVRERKRERDFVGFRVLQLGVIVCK